MQLRLWLLAGCVFLNSSCFLKDNNNLSEDEVDAPLTPASDSQAAPEVGLGDSLQPGAENTPQNEPDSAANVNIPDEEGGGLTLPDRFPNTSFNPFQIRPQMGGIQAPESNFTRRAGQPLCDNSPLCPGRFFMPSLYESRTFQGNSFLADRKEYWATDEAAVFLLQFGRAGYTNHVPLANIRLQIDLMQEGRSLKSLTINQPSSYKMELKVDLNALEPGNYTLVARILNVPAGRVATTLYTLQSNLSKTNRSVALQSFPATGVPLIVHELNNPQTTAWPISTGVPFPKGALESVNDLALLENGSRVPAQFTARATWGPNGSVKWAGVDFVARYNNGTPRNYQLVWRAEATNAPVQTPLNYTQNDNEITVDTGPARYRINRRQFAGIETAWVDLNNDGNFTDAELALNGRGGPFVVDEAGVTYLPMPGNSLQVEVEESGSTRVTVVAKGWYANAQGTQFCKFATRMSFFAGQPQAHISHRTILTYDTRTAKRLRDVAWQFTPNEIGGATQFGADGQPLSATPPNRGSSLFIHQDRSSHFRLMNGATRVSEGRRADGWMNNVGRQVSNGVFLRDIYQKFPKEMEVNNDPGSFHVPMADGSFKASMALHFWPKHGQVAFTETESLARNHIYKDRFAHQGALLDFNMPASYTALLREFMATPGPDLNWDSEDQIPAALEGNAQGVAIGNEFIFLPQAAPASPENLLRTARLFQQSPHAMAPSTWIANAEPDGRFAARDPQFFPALERHLDLAYPSYLRNVIDRTDEYGMWIYADTHDNWMPDLNQARLHRVWNSSHYQNVWGGWFQYLRGGQKDQYEWARVNSDHFRDVETINYPRATRYGLMPEGAMMHVKGFLPWAGEQAIGNHWVDMSSNLLRYYLTGDRHSLDLVGQWNDSMQALIQSETANRVNSAATCTGAANMTMRVNMPVVAELAYLYEATWDPRLLQFITEGFSYMFDVPFECTMIPGIHPLIHGNWVHRYYNLTRDPRVVERLTAWTRAGYSNPMANAFLYRQTGDRSYLEAVLPRIYDMAHQFYDNPSDTLLHGSTTAEGASYAVWMKEAPYLLQALKDAGMTPTMGTQAMAYPVRPATLNNSYAGYKNTRGWSPSGLITLISPQERPSFRIETQSISGNSSLYFVLNSLAESRTTQFNGTINNNAKSVRLTVPVNPNADLYRFECAGMCDFETDLTDGLPEVAVMTRNQFANGGMTPSTYATSARQHFYIRPLDDELPVELLVESETQRPWPGYVRLEDANGRLIQETSLMPNSQRSNVRLQLDPKRSPYPWRLYTTTPYSMRMRISDPATPELFFATDPEAFDEILPMLNLP